jgi:15-cis-phytoene desaturase
MGKKVAIIGGGVAGLTAAHELKERGFEVTVYEQHLDCGGKARSFPVPAYVGNPDIVGLPAEHGFRFYPGFYKHLIHTFSRIPSDPDEYPLDKYPGRYVIDDLISIPQAAYSQEGKTFYKFPTQSPQSVYEYLHALRDVFNNLRLGLQAGEATFAAVKLLNAMTMCNERREAELDQVTWWNYMSANEMSDAYRKVVVNGLTQNFVAMDAEQSSTKSVINILARLLNDFMTAGSTIDRILNGPTSDVWIRPWRKYLEQRLGRGEGAVTFHLGWRVARLEFEAKENRITGLRIEKTEERKRAEDSKQIPVGAAPKGTGFDFCIAAVPVEAMQKILDDFGSRDILEHAPSLKLIKRLNVNWMSGVIFYLKEDVKMCAGHVIYLDSPWAITSISQNQFWTKKIDTIGIRRAQGIISTIISDWDKPGNKSCRETAREVGSHDALANEVLAQVRAHLRAYPEMILNTVGHFVDPAIVYKRELMGLMSVGSFARRSALWESSGQATNLKAHLEGKDLFPAEPVKKRKALGTLWDKVTVDDQEPLFINTVGSWSHRPGETTGIDNLFLASDYVKTNTDLATMEGANEAGRRAVNAILEVENSKRKRCEIFEFEEPAFLAGFKAIDRELFDRGLPHPSFFVDPFISFGAKAADRARRWVLRK